ncbi:MAG TPA: flippase-like domain-containing protein [Thermoplasmatales archaeon]|nr:flippase-like domain-containing protein [Thermoplasmatales archaeon]
MEPVSSNRKIKIYVTLSVLLSVIIITLLLYFTVDNETINYLMNTPIRYEYFIIAVILQISTWVIWGARLKVLSNAIGEHSALSLWDSTKIVMANMFLAGITPSMAGGEPIRIYLLNKNGVSLGAATASVLGERLLDAFIILGCVPIAFIVFQQYLSSEILRLGLTIGVFVFLLAITLFFLAIRYPDKTKNILVFISRKLGSLRKKGEDGFSIIERINKEVDTFNKCIKFFLSSGRKPFLIGGFLTALYWGTAFMIPSMILLGLNLPPHFLASYAAQVLLIVIIMMPTTPGSAGVGEGSIAALYTVLIGSTLIGVFVLIFRFITFHLNMIIGAIFQYKMLKTVTTLSIEDKLEGEIHNHI